MRVLFISGSFPPIRCGVGDYTALVAGALAERGGVTVGVLTSVAAGKSPAPAGVELLALLADWRLGKLALVLATVRAWKPDLVHIQYPTRGYGRGKMPLLLPFLLGRMKIPVVQTWHEPLSQLRALRYLPCALTRDALVTVEARQQELVPGWLWRLIRRKPWYRQIPVGAMIPIQTLDAAERATIRARFDALGHNLVAYFGFAIPSKGIESLFDIADPDLDRIVLLCDLDPEDACQQRILARVNGGVWQGKAFVTGFLDAHAVSGVLAAADAAVYPFTTGMTGRNTSVLAARAQGTFVLTTLAVGRGYDAGENVYYAAAGATAEMRQALRSYAGHRTAPGARWSAEWGTIALEHLKLYEQVLRGTGRTPAATAAAGG